MTAETPAARQVSTPSAKGKKASEAQTAPLAFVAGLLDREPGALDAVHLAGPDADDGAVARQHDGVRLDVAHDAPGEGKVGQLARVRLRAGSPFATAAGSSGSTSETESSTPPPAARASSDGAGRLQ